MNEHSTAALYGVGVFTTMRISGGKPWLWSKHWRRLTSNADVLGMDLSTLPEDKVLEGLNKRLATEQLKDGRARITLHDNRSSDVWPGEIVDEDTTMSIITGPPRQVAGPFRCGVSPYAVNSTSPLAGLKTCNYLEQTVAVDEAKERGFNEAIRVNERGHVTSACMANVFWLKGAKLFVPALSTGCLPGTTREFVLENVETSEVESKIDDLIEADAIFLASAGLGVVAVDEFDGRSMSPADHRILNLMPN